MTNRLREERKKRGLSAAQLASVMNWTEGLITSIEKLSYYPSGIAILRLAKFFNIHPAELFLLGEEDLKFNEVPEEVVKVPTFLGIKLPWVKSLKQ